MELTRPFTSLNKQNADIAGGKGASLGEMNQAGIPVPPGFVVLSGSFEQFLRETDLVQEIDSILSKVDHKEIHTVERASEDIKNLILSREMPEDIKQDIEKNFKALGAKFVAVRSSATAEDGAEHAWAGQLESYLNTTEADLLEKVKHCWASLFTPRAIFYRFEKGLHTTKISVAVVVQKMVESEVSGIAFSVHPVTEDRNQLIIEAGFGLGEAIVSGSVTPDSYVVEKNPRKILDINVSTQSRGLYKKPEGGNEWVDIAEPKASSQVLDENQIDNLSDIILRIEEHYGFPCDIEWAYEAGNFYIVQSRPITTLSTPIDDSISGINPSDYEFHGLWKCNLFSEYYWTEWLVPEYAQKIDLDLKNGGIFVVKGGNFFVKKSTIQDVKTIIDQVVLSKDSKKINELRKLTDSIYSESIDGVNKLISNDVEKSVFDEIVGYGRNIMFPWCLGYLMSTVFDKEYLAPAALKEGIKEEDISSLIPAFDTPLFESNKFLKKILIEVESAGYWHVLKEDSVKGLQLINEDKKILGLINEYIDKYGWTTITNFIGEEPTVERIVEQMTYLKNDNVEEPKLHKLSEDLEFLVNIASNIAYMRQTGVEYFSIYSRSARKYFVKTAEKLGIKYEEFLNLLPNEIADSIRGVNNSHLINKRNNDNWAIYTGEGVPVVIDETATVDRLVDVMVPRVSVGSHDVINGQIGNKGLATGKVKIFLTPNNFEKMEDSDVLVTTMTTPDFVPLMRKASAIVTDIGGLLCHAAIISREIGKPCVIGTKFATQILKDGDMVEVDADKGVVRILKNDTHRDGLSGIFKDKSEYIGLGQWIAPVIEYEAWMDWANTIDAKAFDLGLDNPAAIAINGHYFLPKRGSYSKLRERVGDEFETGKFKATKKLLDLAENLSIECIKSAKKLGSQITFEEFLEAFELMSRLRFPWTACFPIGDAGEEYVKEYAKENDFSVEEVVEMIPQLSNSLNDDQKELAMFKQQIEKESLPFDISSIEKGNQKLADQIKKYQRETEYIGTHHFWGEERTIERLMDAIKNSTQASTGEKIKKVKSEAFDIIAQATKWRLECAQSSAYLAYRFRDFMTNLAKDYGLTYGELIFLSTDEIKKLIEGRADILNIIPQRQKAMGILKLEGRVHVIVGQELDSLEKHFGLQDKVEDLDEFKGAVGNKGFVRGRVVIVLKPDDQSKVEPGVILVAPETTPDFIPSMGKAAAFVTDQGGITSHAAIVAREMGKPCITGTKIATKVLKDGDMVEVDADNGVVRKLV